jgi:hypothetical protein
MAVYPGISGCLAMLDMRAGFLSMPGNLDMMVCYAGWLSCLLCWLSLMAMVAGYAVGYGDNL